jgi:hypothetical protein
MSRLHSITAALIIGAALAHASPRAQGPAEDAGAAVAVKPIGADIDALRRSFIELRRDITLADTSKLVPGDAQIAVYVSVDPRAKATLAALSIEINGAVVGVSRYSDRQREALHRGASDAVYIGTVASGASNLAATISGTRADGNAFVKTTTLDLPEAAGPRFVELQLAHTQTKDLPDVNARVFAPDDVAATIETACDWLLGCPPAAATAASDLQYRSVLYPLYQDQHEQALVRAMALLSLAPDDAAARVRLRLAQLDAALATGNRGVTDDAVAALAAERLEPQTRVRFALLHARDCHRRQDWAGLHDALDQFDQARREVREPQPIPHPIDAEVAFMRADLATADGDFDRAQYIISTELSPQDALRAYALFNLGVTLRTAGIPTRAERVFTQLASMPVYTDEALDLKGRARIALSVIDLQRTQSASAEAALRDAPAKGRYHDQFMASYGSRAMEHGDYELAARIWLTLATEAPWSSAGKTAQVAYPMCLEHIAAPNVVLAQYRDAEAKFEQRLTDLDALMTLTGDSAWDARLLQAFAGAPETSVLSADPTLSEWRGRIGHDDWLYWLNADSTQLQLQQLRELEQMSAWLSNGAPPEFGARARSLATNASRLADDRRARLSRSIADIARNEVAMAQQQLRLIRVGIARTTDRIAEQRPSEVTR